jgi:uncharacterized membrane protein
MLTAPYYLIALALVGIANTLYLSLSIYTGVAPSCVLEGCEVVLNSPYSKLFGVPLSYIGLVYYLYMLCLAALLAVDPRSLGLRLGTLIYTGVGLVMSGIFIYIQGVLIGAYCQYCLISAVLTLLLFGVALNHYRRAMRL